MNGSDIKGNQIEALARRIDEIESRNAMRDLVSNYCHGFDRRDWDCFIGIWHEDAVWDIGPLFGEFHGHEGIQKAVQEILYPVWRESHHLTTNLSITFVDDDHANYLDGDWDENDGHGDPGGHVVEEIRGVDHHGEEVHVGLECVHDEVHHEDHGEHSVEEHDGEVHGEHFDQFLSKWTFLDAFWDI